MTFTRFSKVLLIVLALALCAGTASAQISAGTPTLNFTYTKGSVSAPQTSHITDGGSNTTYSKAVNYDATSGANTWLTVTNTGSVPEDLQVDLDTAVTDVMAPGNTYVGTIRLTGGTDSSTAVITVNLTISSPLSGGAASSNAALTFVKTGGAGQAASATTVTVTNSDAAYDSYTTVKSGSCPAWLDVTSANGKQAKSGTNDTLTLSVNVVGGAAASVGTTNGCNVQLQYLGVTFKTVNLTLSIVSQPLLSSASSIALTYTKGGGGNNSGSTNLSVASGASSVPFNVDLATVPMWMTVAPATGTATSGGTAVTLSVSTAVAAGMPTGNYSASVGFFSGTFSDVMVPVTFSISNSQPSIGLKEGTTQIDGIWSYGAAHPQPTVTPFSTNEPLPFTASCAVVVTSSTTYTPTATSCLLNGSQATVGAPVAGVAYTWGYGLTVTLDNAIFSYPIGTTAKVTVTVTPQGSSAVSLAYKYTFQPQDPTITTIFPTSVAQIAHNTSMVVLINGTNFVGPQNIANGSVVPTQVYLNGSTTALTQSNVVVVSGTKMMITIPQASFPTYASGKTAANLSIGLANQTGAAAPTAQKVFTNLVVTNAPVVYAITSTASYQNSGLGVPPGIAPFELISIFGDNFGYAGLTPNFSTATLNSFNQVPTSLVVTGSGKTAVNLTVTFKDGQVKFSAPILFANQNQINAMVPGGLTVSDTVSVTVTSGATTNVSDGTFTATVVANDPGVFTLASDGVGQGAILNHDYSVNSATNAETIGQFVQIYMTGLGAPNSTAPDVASQSAASYPGSCSAISLSGASTPGYMQVVNAKANGYTPPSPAWTNIDGAVIQSSYLKTNILAPCMTDNVTVTFDAGGTPTTATTVGGGVLWAGFASGSVAGLYQINVTIPPSTTTGTQVPVTVTINGHTSPPVTMAIQ